MIKVIGESIEEKGFIENGEFIEVNTKEHSIKFILQEGPIKENGRNGCQVDQIIEVAKRLIEGFNKRVPCIENTIATDNLNAALEWLKKRKEDREKREVEGTNER